MEVIGDWNSDVCWVLFIEDYYRVVCGGIVVYVWYGLIFFNMFYSVVKVVSNKYYYNNLCII